jgi:predicted permease
MRLRLRTDRLATILASSRLSQNHWALRLGLSRGHWSDLVNGRHPFPSAKTRQRMLEVFDVAEDDLFVAEQARSDDIELRLALSPRYEIVRELGQGAMGTVFLATDRELGRMVAIKVVSPEAAAGVGSRALLREIAFVARLQHPNILPLFDAGEVADHPYYVMPYVRDGSLRALLQRRSRLGVNETLDLVNGIARGLSHAHEQQVLHCDVKPENILVQDVHCFVMDFGIARKLRSEAHEWRGLRKELDFSAGTPAYVSPEQASGDEVDQRSDIYSLACVIYETLSGRAPFGGRTTQETVTRRFHEAPPSLTSLAPNVNKHVALVLEQAMTLDPLLRPATARELADSLRAAASGKTVVPAIARLPVADRERTARRGQAPVGRKSAPRIAMTGFRSDLRYAVRSLTRGWRFALGVILTLGLGIGLGAPVLSLADHFFLRPPPGVSDPDRVLRLVLHGVTDKSRYFTDGLTGLDYAVMSSRARTVAGIGAWVSIPRSLGRGVNARSIKATLTSASYFPVLGVRPFRGRFYHESEDVQGMTEAPCVVSYQFWRTDLDGARDAIGRTLLIGNVTYTVVGVTPPEFSGIALGANDVWLPLHVAAPEFQGNDPELWTTDHSAWLRLVARLAPGVSITHATTEADLLYRTSGERTRDRHLAGTFVWDPLQPGRSSLGNRSAKISLWLGAGGVLLLILVAANLTNLFVARSAGRARQTAMRLALGGGWRELLRLELTEVMLLGAAAAAVGLAIATPAVRAARALLLPGVAWVRPAFDARIAFVAFGIAFGVGAIVALWGTVQALRADPIDLLRGASTSQMSASRRANAVRRALLVVQAAVFAVLLTSASAFVLSMQRATRVDFGFDVRDVMATRVSFPAGTPRAEVRALMRRAQERVAALPGVQSASLGYMEPWVNNTEQPISVPGSTVKPPMTMFDMATPEYLRTFGVPMRQGRWIETGDGPNAPPVVVVNESLERVFWRVGSAVGQCMRVGADSMPCRTVIGVVRDFHVMGGADDPPKPGYYIPVAQTERFRQTPILFVRATGSPPAAMRAVRQAVQSLEANLPATDVHPIARNIDWLLSPLRLGAAAFTAFGLLAAIVGAVGLYSVLAFLIMDQRRAHAIRLAVGAEPARLARSVVRFAIATAGVGVTLGFAMLVPIARLIEPLLFHTRVLDPLVLLAVAVLGVMTALGASLVPVRTVLKTDVMAVLREQ